MTQILIPQNEKVYSVETLYNLTQEDLAIADRETFQMLWNRQYILLDLLNAGIEYTTLAQLNQIH